MKYKVKHYSEFSSDKKFAYPNINAMPVKSSKCVVVGNLVFVSGTSEQKILGGKSISTKFEDQMILTLDKIKGAMEESGSSMNNIVKTLIITKNLDDYHKMRRVELEYYQRHASYLVENPPASTHLVPNSLLDPNLLVEIEVIGVIDRDAPGWQVKYYPAFWGDKKLAYPYVAPEAPKFAKSEVVGNLIFVSGCAGVRTDNLKVEKFVEDQTIVALDKLRIAMEEAGGSMNNIVKTYLLVKNLEDYSQIRKVELEYFQKYAPELVEFPPASTLIQVDSLAWPEFLVEIDAIGVVDKRVSGWEVKYYTELSDSRKSSCSNTTNESSRPSKCVTVGNLVFVSGTNSQLTLDGSSLSNRLEDQTIVALNKIKEAMEEAGSSINNIVKTLIITKNSDDYHKIRRIELEYYQKYAPRLLENPPANTFFQTQCLETPELLVGIDAIGVI